MEMNTNSKQDPSNLNISSNGVESASGATGTGGQVRSSSSHSISRGSSGNMAAAANNNNDPNNFLLQNNNNDQVPPNGNDSNASARRVSKDLLTSRESSLTDLLNNNKRSAVGGEAGANTATNIGPSPNEQVATSNLALMSMLAAQAQQEQDNMMGGGGMNVNNSVLDSNTNSMNQFLMNRSSTNSNPMDQLSAAATMGLGGFNNNVGGINNNNNNSSSFNINHNPSAAMLLAAANTYGLSSGNVVGMQQQQQMISQNPDILAIPPKKTNSKKKLTFAQKLMQLLNTSDLDRENSIRWMPNGMSFCIVDPKELVEKVLPKHFKEAKYTSFTRKLNRWGFKHFTLPSSDPSREDMSIYTHDLFLRDNPSLCSEMDGGHRRRKSQRNSEAYSDASFNQDMNIATASTQMSLGNATAQDLLMGRRSSATLGGAGTLAGQSDSMEQLQQKQTMLLQQMQAMEQQKLMMQHLQQQVAQQQSQLATGQQTNLNQAQLGGQPHQGMQGLNAAAAASNNFNNNVDNPMTMMDRADTTDWLKASSLFNRRPSVEMGRRPSMDMASLRRASIESIGANMPMGMRRTSLGFMPYLPTSNRRGSGFSFGGLSAVSGADLLAGIGDDNNNVPIPSAVAVKVEMNNSTATVANQGGEGKICNEQGESSGSMEGGKNQEDIRQCQAKLVVLEEMITKERAKQSLLENNLNVDTDTAVPK